MRWAATPVTGGTGPAKASQIFLDNHIIYAPLLIGLALVGAGNTLGLGHRWAQTKLVQHYSWLT